MILLRLRLRHSPLLRENPVRLVEGHLAEVGVGISLLVDRRCYTVSKDSFVRRRGPSPETAYPLTVLIHRLHQHAPN